MSGADPCTGSNKDGYLFSGLIFPDGAIPIVPVQAGPKSDKISPNKFDATKSNGISITMPFWDERFDIIKKNYPEIKTDQFHIDILTARFVLTPEWFDVVVASNLFGDILSDLGPACTGTIGIAPSGNINPENKYPSLFEPVHGSAPDIAGKGIANPIGQIWSGALMLDHLGEKEAAKSILNSIEKTLSAKENRTKDLHGSSNTVQCAKAVLSNIN